MDTKTRKLILLTSLLTMLTVVLIPLSRPRNIKEIPSKTPAKQEPVKDNFPTPTPFPEKYVIPQRLHTFQTFNNCGPASLSMALSYFDKDVTQETLGKSLRPYQILGGNNDDKSVTLEELADEAKNYGLNSFHRPSGNIELLKSFISNNIPVVTRTLTKPDEDIGHYRLVRGYTTTHIIQDDSLQGKNLYYTYDEFDTLWRTFNYEYLVLVPSEKLKIAKDILGENVDETTAWRNSAALSKALLNTNENDLQARFNLSVSLYNIGDYEKSVEEFEKVENRLPFRTLWYQTEPIFAYFMLGNYQKVFELTDGIINRQNRAVSELYLLRGNIYKIQGNINLAKSEYEKAVFYNINLQEAKDALQSTLDN